MNIFCLDKDPEIAARQHCDKHCVKMVLECNQLLCTTFWMQGIEAPYRKTHYNHPSAIWARESRGNFEWLVQHAAALISEYTERYGKRHKSTDTLIWVLENKHRLNFDKEEQTEFAVAIAQDQRCRKLPNFETLSVVQKYREYYNHDKSYMAKWQYSETPKWYKAKMKEQYIIIDEDGNKFYFSDREMTILHREDGPAVERTNGYKAWYLNAEYHRKDGPAIEWEDGTKQWWVNGKLHREDGPAVERTDGDNQWYLNGCMLTENEFNDRNKVEFTLDEIAACKISWV